MPITTDLISFPDAVAWVGGDLVTVIRAWPTGHLPLTCTYQVGGQSHACSTGRDDQGYQIVPIGQIVRVAIPALPDSLWQRQAGALVFADSTGAQVFTLPLAVVPPFYNTCTYTLRSDLPPRWAVGPRSLLTEPPAQSTRLSSLTATVGLGLSLFGGQRQTRLTAQANPGDSALAVERSEGLPVPGRVSVGRATYRYQATIPGQLQGIQAEVGGDLVPNVLAVHQEDSPVTDVSGTFSEIDSLRASFFVDTATGTDLAVIGRLLGVPRSPSLSGDDQYRELIKALGYAPRGSEQTLENVLDIIVGPGKYQIGKDPFKNPGQVVVTIPGGEPVGKVSVGRTYLSGTVAQAPNAAGALVTGAPVVGVGSLLLAEGLLVEDLTHALPSSAWGLPAGAATQSPQGALLPGFQAALTYRPPGLDAGGTLEVGMVAALLPAQQAASRAVVDLVADDGSRRATVRVLAAAGVLSAVFIDSNAIALSPTARLGLVAGQTTFRLSLTARGATFSAGRGRLALAASALPASSAGEVAIAPSAPSQSDWSLAVSALRGGFTSTRDYWSARAQATASDAETVTLSPAVAEASDVGRRVTLGDRLYRVAAVTDAATLVLMRDTGHNGSISRAQNVSYLTCGDVPLQFPDDLGNTVQILTDDSQESGTFTIAALYAVPGGRDLSTYQTKLPQAAQVAKLVGNPQPATGLDYRIGTALKAGKSSPLVIGGAGVVSTSADGKTVTLTPRQALPDSTATYAANVSRVLSAQMVDGNAPSVVRYGSAPPFTFSCYPFFVYDPFDLVETYLPDTMPVGMGTQVVYGNGS